MKAVLMRRHQTMADVVPITTLLAILICIGYCSDTAGGTTLPGSDVVLDEVMPEPKAEGAEVSEIGPEADLGSSGLGSTGVESPNVEAQLDASSNPGTVGPEVSVQQSSQGQPSEKPEAPIEDGQTELSSTSPQEVTQQPLQQFHQPSNPTAGGTSHTSDTIQPQASEQAASASGGTGSQNGERPGAIPEPILEAILEATGGTETTAGPPQSSVPRTAVTEEAASAETPSPLPGAPSTPAASSPSAASNPIQRAPLTTPQQQSITPISQDTQTEPSTSANPTTVATAVQQPAQPLPGAQRPVIQQPSDQPSTSAQPSQPASSPPSSKVTPQTIPTTLPAEPSTSTQAKAGSTTETGAGTTADGEISAPVTVKVTTPGDTAGTLPGTTDSRTTRQGPSPPAGASQASADVTVQQGPTPEEKKEQQKEVTGITPQGSPRQEGQQQKGQTPQGPPPLGSTSGATPGKDNTRETAKTPPTGTDTNNNNNNITIPKIAVNETIISATVVPSAIPAVLVCSVVFLYLSRR